VCSKGTVTEWLKTGRYSRRTRESLSKSLERKYSSRTGGVAQKGAWKREKIILLRERASQQALRETTKKKKVGDCENKADFLPTDAAKGVGGIRIELKVVLENTKEELTVSTIPRRGFSDERRGAES